MKDKKDGKNRSYVSTTNQNTSPLATSTMEKDDLTHRAYHHQIYYPPNISASFQSPVFPITDRYELPTNYDVKQSNYYTPHPPTSYDNYYFNIHNQQQF
jgi:hypothetical protein